MKRIAAALALVSMVGVAGGAALRPSGSLAAPTPPAKPAPRPNVVVILADDVGYADISTYKIKRIPTPNIDRIGKQGVIFTDAYATAPVCGPSRAGLNTGRYQERFGFEFNNGPAKREVANNFGLPEGEITLAKAMQGVGYHTGLVGKWHLGANPPFYPTNRGYDEFVGFLPGQTAYMTSTAPGLHIFRDVDTTEGTKGGAGGVDRNPYTQVLEGPDRTVVHNENEYLTDYFGDRAVDFIHRNAKASKPYFLYLAPNAAHAPIEVTQKYYDRFPNIKDERSRIYAGMVSALDDMVGRVTKAIDDSGQADNTLVYFMSDNGCAAYYPGMCACDPLRGGKLTHYEGGVRVPFMMRWPSVLKPGQVNRQVVSTLDIFPTVLNAAGGQLPTDRIYDGVDMIPYLTGRKQGAPHDMLAWRRQPMASIRKGDWKLWKSLDGKFTLLFNLKTDLNETTNLADKNPAKLKELTDAYDQWAKDMQDPRWPSRPLVTFDVCGTPFTVPI